MFACKLIVFILQHTCYIYVETFAATKLNKITGDRIK